MFLEGKFPNKTGVNEVAYRGINVFNLEVKMIKGVKKKQTDVG